MKTLIIHPEDHSTFFLRGIYRGISNQTLVTKDVSREHLMELISEHDRVIMLGHGSPSGLFSVGRFEGAYVIDKDMVPLLEQKSENIYIWCNADQFVLRHSLKGFFSGMFISEVGEATYCGVSNVNQNMVNESNYGFVHMLGQHIKKNKTDIHRIVRRHYAALAKYNPVAAYNNKRLYLN